MIDASQKHISKNPWVDFRYKNAFPLAFFNTGDGKALTNIIKAIQDCPLKSRNIRFGISERTNVSWPEKKARIVFGNTSDGFT